MARIAGVNLPESKRIEIGLTYIYGIGLPTSQRILTTVNISPDKRVKDLTTSDVQKLSTAVRDMTLEGELKQVIFRNIKRLRDIKCYRGIRHRLGLPVRGQKTRTNAVTRKGKNIAVGGLKRKIEKT